MILESKANVKLVMIKIITLLNVLFVTIILIKSFYCLNPIIMSQLKEDKNGKEGYLKFKIM
jgi:hypothetical protein